MSSSPLHNENMARLEKMGFDVSEYKTDEDGFSDSLNIDDLPYIIKDILDMIDEKPHPDEKLSNKSSGRGK